MRNYYIVVFLIASIFFWNVVIHCFSGNYPALCGWICTTWFYLVSARLYLKMDYHRFWHQQYEQELSRHQKTICQQAAWFTNREPLKIDHPN